MRLLYFEEVTPDARRCCKPFFCKHPPRALKALRDEFPATELLLFDALSWCPVLQILIGLLAFDTVDAI
jgi:hypothetical protein